MPAVLLSDPFHSGDSFLAWVQRIANTLPLRDVNVGMRPCATEDGSVLQACWSGRDGNAMTRKRRERDQHAA